MTRRPVAYHRTARKDDCRGGAATAIGIACALAIAVLVTADASPAKAQPAPQPTPDQTPDQTPDPEQQPTPDPAKPNPGAPLKDRAPISTEKLRPWAEGVPTDKQEEALKLFQEGNKMLRDALFIKAADLYREALSNWDHPAIHYNLALSLITLDQPIAVFQSLERAMAFGPEPLEAENFQRAINYRTLVSQLIADVEVVCEVPGARVSLDGKELFVGPGKWTGLARIGEHTLVAQKSGFLPTNQTRRFAPAEQVVVNLELFTIEDVTSYRRRWAAWKPYSVLGGGAAVAAIGGIVHLSAAGSMNEFNDGILACGGCVPDSSLAQKRDSARTKETIAYLAYGIGVSAIAAGVVLAYINREQAFRDESKTAGLEVVPTITPSSAGFSATVSF